MAEYGVTQQILADRMGINRVSVSRLLSEKNDLRLSTIEKIADAIGCPIGELFAPSGKEDDFVALVRKGKAVYSASTIDEARSILDKLKKI